MPTAHMLLQDTVCRRLTQNHRPHGDRTPVCAGCRLPRHSGDSRRASTAAAAAIEPLTVTDCNAILWRVKKVMRRGALATMPRPRHRTPPVRVWTARSRRAAAARPCARCADCCRTIVSLTPACQLATLRRAETGILGGGEKGQFARAHMCGSTREDARDPVLTPPPGEASHSHFTPSFW